MSDKEYALQDSFWDELPTTQVGFDTVVNYVNRTYEMVSKFNEVILARITIMDTASKSLAKLSKMASKFDRPEPVYNFLSDIFILEANGTQRTCEELTRFVTEGYAEKIKKQHEVMKKAKSETMNALRNRKTQYENSIKTCKIYTSKYRLHDQLMKKHIGMEQDEKVNQKLSKSLQAVKWAEKDARVSIEMLNQSLEEYFVSFTAFCSKIQTFCKAAADYVEVTLTEFHSKFCKNNEDITKIYASLTTLPDEMKYKVSIEKFVAEKGTANVYLKHAVMSETGEGDKITFLAVLSPTSGGTADPSNQTSKTSGTSTETPKSTLYGASPALGGGSNSNISIKNSAPITTTTSAPQTPPQPDSSSTTAATFTVRALFDYKAQNPDELTFERGDTITVLTQEDDAWYVGRLPNGETGAFPLNYCENV